MDAKLLKENAKCIKPTALLVGIAGIVFSVFKMVPLDLGIATIAAMALIVGLVYAFNLFDKFAKAAKEEEAKAFKQLKLAAILYFSALAVDNLFFVGGCFAAICVVVASVFLLLAAKQLKADCPAFKLIFIAAIIGIVAGVFELIGVIPVIGIVFNVIGRLADVAVFVLILITGIKLAQA
ncbi:MAG: hypothetical protein II457_02960 [Paludibacteraceae bacterium]|nr:hypothetical protein [Paludibacteraceae bacterium]